MFVGDNLVQKVHPEQRYAVISVHKGHTTVVKLSAIDKCGQMSNFSQISIAPTNHSDSDVETTTAVGWDYTTATAGDSQGISSITLGLLLTCIIFTTLMSVFFVILCTVIILMRYKHHPISGSDNETVTVRD